MRMVWFGRRRFWRWWIYPPPYPYMYLPRYPFISPEDELKALEDYKKHLEEEKADIEEEIREVEMRIKELKDMLERGFR
jgi:hypothetical protein